MTEAPLRAFLMMRSGDGTWAVTVCRDLGAVMHTWKARKEPDRDVAVLHAGFDRPLSHTFDEIAGAHPGRMLLTTAAKHVLPKSFTASAAPVGLAENTEVFFGLQGWGYVLEDPTARADRLEPARANTATQEPQGWVASFLHENPSVAEALSTHGIHDEASYLEGESDLERSVRHRSGVFRTHHLVGANCDDPCKLARAAPPWLAERDLTTLDLPVRADNVFRKSKIEMVRDLAAWSPQALLNLQNFGLKSLRDTWLALYAALNEGPQRFPAADSVPEPGQLLTEMRRSLLSFTDRERGSLLEDPTARANRPEPARANTATPNPQGWVASFLYENPSVVDALSAHGIDDETSYLEGESDLERSVRHRSGVFRAHHLVGANCDDPCKLARAAPPWLADRDLTTLDLPVRAGNVFRTSEIEVVRDLAAWSPRALLNLQNFGLKSLRDTWLALNAALNEGPLRLSVADSVPEPGQLLTELRRSLLSFTDRERGILIRRLGFETPPKTLQQVADDYEVTRERIRQIEARATQKWIRESCWDDILEQKITRLLIGRTFPLPVAGVEAVDSWFEGVSSHLEFFKNLVEMVCEDRIHFVEIDDLYYFSLIDQDLWERTVSEAAALLSSGAGRKWSEDYARSLVHGLLPDAAREFGPLLWDKATQLCHFSIGPDGSRVLTSYGRGAEQLVEAILAESGTPLHYTEIVERARLRGGKSLDPRRALSAAASIGFLFTRGTYGLARHVPLSDEQMSRIRMEAEDIVCSETSGKQWHSSEILSELSERLEGGLDGLDKYVLDIALARSMILSRLGKMTWAEAGQDSNGQARIAVHQGVIAIVKAAGRPLSTGEIKERLTAVRGVNESFQIFPVDPLIRVKPGVWGINDRDVPLSREKQAELVEELIQILEEKHRGIHTSELSGVLPLKDCPPDAFLSIAAQDGRLKLSQGRNVYLAEWGSPRRETIGHAVSAVLEKASKPLTLDEIVSLVERRVGRKCNRPVISGALQAVEAEFDEMIREWSLNTAPSGDGDNDADAADGDSPHQRQVSP